MLLDFDLNDKQGLLSAATDRMCIINQETNKIYIVKPVSITGYVEHEEENVTCLTFNLDERLNLGIWRNMCSSIYEGDKELTHGEVYDLINTQNILIEELQEKLAEYEKEK